MNHNTRNARKWWAHSLDNFQETSQFLPSAHKQNRLQNTEYDLVPRLMLFSLATARNVRTPHNPCDDLMTMNYCLVPHRGVAMADNVWHNNATPLECNEVK